MRVGNIGKLIAMDVLERVTTMGTALSYNLDRMTKSQKDRYREFLLKELKRLEQSEAKQMERMMSIYDVHKGWMQDNINECEEVPRSSSDELRELIAALTSQRKNP